MKSKSLSDMAILIIASWYEDRRIALEAIFLSGIINEIVDFEPCVASDSSDLKLEPTIFQRTRLI